MEQYEIQEKKYGYFDKLHLSDSEVFICISHRDIRSIEWDEGRVYVRYGDSPNCVRNVKMDKVDALNLSKYHLEWCNAMSKDIKHINFLPNIEKELNSEIQQKVDEGVTKILSRLDTFTEGLVSRGESLASIADNYTKVFKD